MHEEFKELGWDFQVWFMASSESGRHWSLDSSEYRFPYRFLSARSLRLGYATLHWNPEISKALRDEHPDILLVAGGWIHPTVLLSTLSSVRKIFWSESHLHSIRHNNSVVSLARKWMLSRFKEFAVPGALARKYVEHHTRRARVHDLPNLVDPSVFCDLVAMYRRTAGHNLFSSDKSHKRLLIVARLVEEKGLIPFLEGIRHLSAADQINLTVLIAGSGPLKPLLERYIARNGFDVRLLGHQTQSQMATLYSQADGFCLPSISDPNPISVIEALWAGLPLLLSSRVGNHPECLRPGENGFLFDYTDPEAIAASISQWLALPQTKAVAFRENSLRIARSCFDPDRVLRRFIEDVVEGCTRSTRQLLSTPVADGPLLRNAGGNYREHHK